MEQKFIEGTNKKYSIREDGTIIRHWALKFIKGRYIKCSKDVVHNNMLCYGVVRAKLRLDNKVKFYTIRDLIYSYFIGNIPDDKIVKQKDNDPYNFSLDNLYLHQPLSRKERTKRRDKKKVKNITKQYVAANLKIPLEDLSEELYNHHKELILFKRTVCETHNIKMINLNKK